MRSKSLLGKFTPVNGIRDINKAYKHMLMMKAKSSTDPQKPVDWNIPSEIAKKVL